MRAIEFLTETLDSPYPYKHIPSFGKNYTLYEFKTSDGKLYNVEIYIDDYSNDQPTANITFALVDKSSGNEFDRIQHTGDARRVFSTVIDILKKYVYTYSPPYISFGAREDEPSRIRLYNALVKRAGRVLPDYELVGQNQTDINKYRGLIGYTLARKDLNNNQELSEAMPKWAKGLAGAAGLALGVNAATPTNFDVPDQVQVSNTATAANSDAAILAQTIWGEARNQGYEGMAAIGSVIKNRAEDTGHSKLFGNGIRGVALKNHQFSCWNHNNPNFKYAEEMKRIDRAIHSRHAPGNQDFNSWFSKFKKSSKYLDYQLWEESYELATQILDDQITDPTHGATYYHTTSVHPSWANKLNKIGKIGKHVFYSLPDNS